MLCTHCNKMKEWDDMMTSTICDDCFDKMMEEEDRHFKIFDSQNGKCWICKKELYMWWIIKVDDKEVAVCSPNCIDTPASKLIHIKRKDLLT